MLINTSMLREKFVIRETGVKDGEQKEKKPIIALSNRISLPLTNESGAISEHIVIRGRIMYIVTRFAAKVAHEFAQKGPLIKRFKERDWQRLWIETISGYDERFYKGCWMAVYHHGKLIFSVKPHHPFLDIMEQCDARNKAEYDQSVKIAEDAFSQAGRKVRIEHEATIAMVASATRENGRCGVIVRIPNRTATFNFIINPESSEKRRLDKDAPKKPKKQDKPFDPYKILYMAATFMEGIHLAVNVGFGQSMLDQSIFQMFSPQYRHVEASRKRLGRINSEIRGFENTLSLKYRPERPDFFEILNHAESYSEKLEGDEEITVGVDEDEEDDETEEDDGLFKKNATIESSKENNTKAI